MSGRPGSVSAKTESVSRKEESVSAREDSVSRREESVSRKEKSVSRKAESVPRMEDRGKQRVCLGSRLRKEDHFGREIEASEVGGDIPYQRPHQPCPTTGLVFGV